MAEHKRLGSEWVDVSVSHGTMREEDLIPAFEAVLEGAGAEVNRGDYADAVCKLLHEHDDYDCTLTDQELDQVGYYLNEQLWEELEDIAPEGCYFGAHPGDGCDYGFWTCEDDDSSDE